MVELQIGRTKAEELVNDDLELVIEALTHCRAIWSRRGRKIESPSGHLLSVIRDPKAQGFAQDSAGRWQTPETQSRVNERTRVKQQRKEAASRRSQHDAERIARQSWEEARYARLNGQWESLSAAEQQAIDAWLQTHQALYCKNPLSLQRQRLAYLERAESGWKP